MQHKMTNNFLVIANNHDSEFAQGKLLFQGKRLGPWEEA